MIKFKITPARFAEACSVLDYLGATSGRNKDSVMRIAHRFIVDKDGEYIVKIKLDEDGDIEGFENTEIALTQMMKVTPQRLEKLINEFSEAARAIVNPPSAGA